MLEYYFEPVGLLSIGAFRRDFENFFGSVIFDPSPEFLALYGLDPNIYGSYQASTQHNLASSVRMEGFDFNYKQALTFLPHWARGVQVFANASTLRALGEANANFAGFVPSTYSWGFSVSREKFNVKLNWNYRGRNRRNPVNGRGIEPGTFQWQASQLNANLLGEYRFHRRFALYVSLNTPMINDIEVEGPNTPERAQLNNRQEYGGLWTIGVRGLF
jgi:hypothetical protein